MLAKSRGHAFRDARLAVARRAKQEQPPARIDRRPEPVEHPLVQEEIGEGRVQRLGGRVLAGQRLGPDSGNVVGKRHRRRTEVAALLEVAARALAPQIAELVLVVVHRRRAPVDHQLIDLQLPQELVDQHERQPDLLGDVAPRGVAPSEQVFQDQGFDGRIGELGVPERPRLDRKEIVGWLGRFGRLRAWRRSG